MLINADKYIEMFLNDNRMACVKEEESFWLEVNPLLKSRGFFGKAEVFTPDIFPRILDFSEGKLLLWDTAFWRLYEMYLYTASIDDEREEPVSEEDTKEYLSGVVYLSLAIQFYCIPKLSCYAAILFITKAERFLKLGLWESNAVLNMVPLLPLNICLEVNMGADSWEKTSGYHEYFNNKLMRILEASKIVTILHEVVHTYDIDNNTKTEMVQEFLNLFAHSGEDPGLAETNLIKHDIVMQNELICDTEALMLLLSSYNSSKYPDLDSFYQEISFAMHSYLEFKDLLIRIKNDWIVKYKRIFPYYRESTTGESFVEKILHDDQTMNDMLFGINRLLLQSKLRRIIPFMFVEKKLGLGRYSDRIGLNTSFPDAVRIVEDECSLSYSQFASFEEAHKDYSDKEFMEKRDLLIGW